eukprot:1342939-Prymnesium_polylepis.2
MPCMLSYWYPRGSTLTMSVVVPVATSTRVILVPVETDGPECVTYRVAPSGESVTKATSFGTAARNVPFAVASDNETQPSPSTNRVDPSEESARARGIATPEVTDDASHGGGSLGGAGGGGDGVVNPDGVQEGKA